MSKINIEAIKAGDRVRVSLHGLPESDWLEVSAAFPNCAEVIMPDGRDRLLPHSEITAHEPAAPALPDWWGAKVIFAVGLGYYSHDDFEDDYVGVTGISRKPEFFEGLDVTVIVDRDGNQPAARIEVERNELRARLSAYHSPDAGEAFDAFHAEQIEIARLKAERDAARDDLAAFRAEVEKVRDDVRNLFDYQIEQRLSAILDGVDQ